LDNRQYSNCGCQVEDGDIKSQKFPTMMANVQVAPRRCHLDVGIDHWFSSTHTQFRHIAFHLTEPKFPQGIGDVQRGRPVNLAASTSRKACYVFEVRGNRHGG